MNITFKHILVGELRSYVESRDYYDLEFYPISRERAISHAENPRADKDDVAIFLAYNDNRLIGYLGAITDFIYHEDKIKKVYWLSCMWILPEFRRYRIALMLMLEAHKTFDGNILITNYIPRSKKVFEKTNQYHELQVLKGIRAYLRFDLARILTRKYNKLEIFQPFLKLSDGCLNSILHIRLQWKLRKTVLKHNYTFVKKIDKQLNNFIDINTKNSSFRRGINEFDWILKYPWVINSEKAPPDANKYYFSWYANDFQQHLVKIEDNNNNIVGALILIIYRGELKTPYIFLNGADEKDVTMFLIQLMIENKIPTYVGYDPTVNGHIIKSKLFWHKRNSEHGILISKKLAKEVNIDKPVLFYGDGDAVFT